MQLIYIYLQQDPLLVARFVGYYSYAYSFMLDSFTERPFISFTEGPFASLTEGSLSLSAVGGLSGAAGPFVTVESLSTSGAVSQRSGLSAVGGLSAQRSINLVDGLLHRALRRQLR